MELTQINAGEALIAMLRQNSWEPDTMPPEIVICLSAIIIAFGLLGSVVVSCAELNRAPATIVHERRRPE
jgi:hypothetical protein